MYLLDTNVFLEILLKRQKSEAAKKIFVSVSPKDLFITDFSLHSIGVFLFQRGKQEAYDRFVKCRVLKVFRTCSDFISCE